MNAATLPSASTRNIALLSALAAIALGISVLAGWAFDIGMLKTVVPGLATMKANTAAGIILCGSALALLCRPAGAPALRIAVAAISIAVIALAGLTLAEDFFGWDIGLDQMLFRDTTGAVEATSPGRVPPAVTFCLLLAASGLLLASRGTTERLRLPIVYGLGSTVVVIGGLSLIGHVSAILSGSRWWDYAGMAIHTAVGFLLLGGGLIALMHGRDPMRWSLNKLITTGVAIGIVSLVAATAFSNSFTRELHRESSQVAHSQEVLTEIEEIENGLAALESGQRGFIITGDGKLLEDRENIARSLDEHFARVRQLVSGSAAQHQRLAMVEPLIAQRKAFGDRTIDVRATRGFPDAQKMIAGGVGIELSRRIQQILLDMEAEEYAALAERHKRSDATATATFLLLPLGVFLSLTILLTGLFLLNAGTGEQLRTEQAMRASEAKYRQLVEQATDGIFVLDAATRFQFANPRTCELLGYREEELLGIENAMTYPENDRHLIGQRIGQARRGAIQRYERMVLRKDGATFPAEVSSRMLDNGGFQVIFHDITERRRTQQALQKERTLLRTLMDTLPDVVFTKDTDGRFTMCNTAAYANSGFGSEEEMLGKTVFDLYPPGMAQPYHADDMGVIAGDSVLNREEISMDANGVIRWFLTIKVPLRAAAGGIVGLIGVSRDITERKQHEDKIARLNRIQAMLSGINSAIVRIHDPDALFREACRIATELGKFPIALIGMLDAEGKLVPAGAGGAGAALLASLPPGARGGPRGAALRSISERATVIENDILREPDVDPIRLEAIARGCRSVISLPLLRDKEAVGMFMLYGGEKDAFDEEEVKLLEELSGDISFALTFIAQQEKVDYLAYYDTLTGLPNRALFFDRLGGQLARATREGTDVGLVLVNLDRFRMINDTLGREAGDALLKAVGDRMKASVREQDTVSRMSADTFAIAVSGAWKAENLARVIESGNRDIFSAPYLIGGEELRVSATSGIAVFPGDAELAETLLANAEAALRSAKQQNVPLLFYGPEMNARAAESLRMENRLRRALERHELELWYQPKIDVRTGKLTGFEALMRWNDREAGMIPPGKFIPIMEQTGLILDAGNWALSQVARDCAGWIDDAATATRIAVNVSPLQLREKGFVAKVVDAAEAIDQAGGCLDLEITESVIMENVDAIIPKLQTIRGLNVRIYIDDFGTGYSSLAYIARLPIYSLKIDRSFVVGMTQNEDSLNIVNSVISLAHALKLCVVAEGVETEEQAKLLKKLACDEYQGYLFGKPVPPREVPGVMKKFS